MASSEKDTGDLSLGEPFNARTLHVFDGGRSLCGSWMYTGGRDFDPDDPQTDPDGICKSCARKVGLVE